MNLADIRAELEEELRWRSEELRFFKNQLSDLRSDDERSKFRRALVVMLYAHFEGFWKAAFSIYVKSINSEAILCKDAVNHLVAASLYELLSALSGQGKHPYFRDRAADDAKLHQLYRQVEFIDNLPNMETTQLALPVDKVVDTESNLWPIVIRKILYRLGFPDELFKSHEGAVWKLVNKRNGVSHGTERLGFGAAEFDELESAVFNIMEDVVKILFGWLRDRKYLKSP